MSPWRPGRGEWRVLFALAFCTVAVVMFLKLRNMESQEHADAMATTSSKQAGEGVTLNSNGLRPPDLLYRIADQQPISYNVTYDSLATLDLSGFSKDVVTQTQARQKNESQGTHFVVNGTLNLQFYSSAAGGWNVAGRFKPERVEIVKQGAPGYAAHLVTPFYFHFDPHGYLTRLTLPVGIDEGAKLLIQRLLTSLQATLPSSSRTEWTTRERGADGLFRVHYRIRKGDSMSDSPQLEKSKLQYLSVDTNEYTLIPDVVSSTALVSLAPRGDWVQSVVLTERLNYRRGTEVVSAAQIRFTAARTAATAEFPLTFDAFVQQMTAMHLPILSQKNTAEQYAARYRAEDVASFLTAVLTNLENSSAAGIDLLVDELQVNPALAAELVSLVDQHNQGQTFAGLTPQNQAYIWLALASAGTLEIQQLMAETLDSPRSHLTTMSGILLHLDALNDPQALLVAATYRCYKGAASTDPDGDYLNSVALLAYGALSGIETIQEELKEEVATTLAGLIDGGRTAEERNLATIAAGNARADSLVPVLERQLRSGSDNTRMTVYDALTRLGSDTAAQTLLVNLDMEAVPEVRQAALGFMAQMPPSAMVVDWAADSARTLTDPTERGLAVNILGNSMNEFPRNRNELRRLYASENDPQVMQSILQYIPPRQ